MRDGYNHYEVLGCSVGASERDLRRAFLRLARRHHPDFHCDSPMPVQRQAQATMQRVNAAWYVIGDPERRREYDSKLNGRAPGGPTGTSARTPHDDWHPLEADDFDPDDFDDTPIGARAGLPAFLAVLPILCLLAGAVALGAALLLNARILVVVAGVLGLVGVAGFVVVPVFALVRSRRGSRL